MTKINRDLVLLADGAGLSSATASSSIASSSKEKTATIPVDQLLAEQLNIALVHRPDQIATEYYLQYRAGGLSLVKTQSDAGETSSVVSCDFVLGALRHRRLFGGGIKQPLARAVGLSSNFKPTVADLTAGLGRDGFLLASLGAQVSLVERNEVVAALLSDGLLRLQQSAEQDDDLRVISERLSLHRGDSKAWLQSLDASHRPDVIYLDPMFPDRSKSAKVKKEMAVFPGLVGSDDDADELLALALNTACYRVVVKRPRRAPPLGGIKPGFSMEGKTTRFDIHPLKKIPR
ncbi:MAG: class I SAM-dependent methyltransferase [Porticoccaceae bacterium]|nr:class I SAM-dependent methyltransferase [Porticoccaceae bacterium]